jgi:hypothetical protein
MQAHSVWYVALCCHRNYIPPLKFGCKYHIWMDKFDAKNWHPRCTIMHQNSMLDCCIICAISSVMSNSSLLMKMAMANDSCVNLFISVRVSLLRILNVDLCYSVILFWKWCYPPSWVPVYAPAAGASSTSLATFALSRWLHEFLRQLIWLVFTSLNCTVSDYSLIWRTLG